MGQVQWVNLKLGIRTRLNNRPLAMASNLVPYKVFVDESSQTKHRYLVLGAIVIPKVYAHQLESDIIEARGERHPIRNSEGKARSIKWEKAKGGNDLVTYRKVIDAFFSFPMKHNLPLSMQTNIHCIAVDMSKRDDGAYSSGDADIGFSKDVNGLCVDVVGRQHLLKDAYSHIFLDRRTTKQSLMMAHHIMNATFAKKYSRDPRHWPFHGLDWAETENVQALQLVDTVIGAIAYKLNGHYEAPNANKTKKALCEHILKKSRIANVHQNTPMYLKRITIFHRNFSRFPKKG